MTSLEESTPDPPFFGAILAATIELSMFATFAANRSMVGGLLCIAYYFSATRAVISDLLRGQ